MIRLGSGPADLARAAELLLAGRLVAFPTETVYGLGAVASDADAVAAIFRAKGRPADHPVIVHLPTADALDDWAREIPADARKLADAFWPGPLTLVLKRTRSVPDVVTGGQDTVGLRVPGNRVARDLLAACGCALAAPSANRFGRISPTTAEHVLAEFGDEVAAVIDGGPCTVGVESTIVDVSGERARLLRPGMVSLAALEAVLGSRPEVAGEGEGPRSSGRLPSHYAPRAALEIVAGARLDEACRAARQKGERVAALTLGRAGGDADLSVVMPERPAAYARRLYAELRRVDDAGCDRIIVERPPDEDSWAAIRDRLRRAAA